MENKNYTLITGATGGLGRAFSFECAKEGKNLLLTATNQERLDIFKKEILSQYDIEILTFACDLSNTDSIKGFLDFISKSKINIDTLINNAGYITEGSFKHAPIDTLLKCIQVNCEGVTHLTKAVLDLKEPQKKLNIITITSMAGEYSMPYMAIYSATKAMLINLMRSIRIEYKKDNVRVLIVEPGAIATSQDMKDAIKAQGLKGKISIKN